MKMQHDDTCAVRVSVDKALDGRARNLLYSEISRRNRNGLRMRLFLLNIQARSIMPANDRILRNVARARNTG